MDHYLKIIIRHGIVFINKKTTVWEIISGMFGDLIFIEDAVGDKVLCVFVKPPQAEENCSVCQQSCLPHFETNKYDCICRLENSCSR